MCAVVPWLASFTVVSCHRVLHTAGQTLYTVSQAPIESSAAGVSAQGSATADCQVSWHMTLDSDFLLSVEPRFGNSLPRQCMFSTLRSLVIVDGARHPKMPSCSAEDWLPFAGCSPVLKT